MTPVPEAEALAAARAALEPYRTHSWNAVQYLWEAVGEVSWDETASESLTGKEECFLVFDPNAWNMAARLEFGRIAKCDHAPLAYRCVKEEMKVFLAQSWVANADFYVLSADGQFLGLRSHEDTESATGMWIPKPSRSGCA